MNKDEALKYICLNPGQIVKLDWWDNLMGIKYDGLNIVSIPGHKVELEFLKEGNFVISSYKNDSELGGLFNIL